MQQNTVDEAHTMEAWRVSWHGGYGTRSRSPVLSRCVYCGAAERKTAVDRMSRPGNRTADAKGVVPAAALTSGEKKGGLECRRVSEFTITGRSALSICTYISGISMYLHVPTVYVCTPYTMYIDYKRNYCHLFGVERRLLSQARHARVRDAEYNR